MAFFIYTLLPVLCISFLTTLVITPIVKKLAFRFKVVDQPADRKVHKIAIPLLGGVGMYFGFALTILAHLPANHQLLLVIGGATLAMLLGFVDDVWHLRASVKLSGQIALATFTCMKVVSIHFISNPFGGGVVFLGAWALPLTVLWLVGMMNTINLIDGLDGLAAGVSGISALFLAVVAKLTGQPFATVLTMALLGSCIGFLRYNFSPAQIFMGDSGSMFLGYVLGVVSLMGVLKSTIAISLFIPILVLGIPIYDTAFAIFRRLKNRKYIFHADAGHIHHRLLRNGLTHRQAAVMMYTGSVVLGLLGLALSLATGMYAVIILGLIFIALIVMVILFQKKKSEIVSFFQNLL